MNILWITNTIFPAPSKALGIPSPVTGGWMYELAKKVGSVQGISLAVATIYTGKVKKKFDFDNIIYYLLPAKSTKSYQNALEYHWQSVCNEFKPNIVHIHGTEFTQGLSCMRIIPSLNYIISIQGMVSIYQRYYNAGIGTWEILKHITFRDLVRFDTIFQGKIDFKRRGKFEKEYIQRTYHVIGRTSWDYAHSKAINPNINYHFCNEILRDSFYTASKWDVNCKNDYTIFISQATYAIKGLHQVLKAVALLKKNFPKLKFGSLGRVL